jgi:hypothetical protein
VNDVPLLRNSERTDFRRCVWRWDARWNKNLVPIELSTGPLVFGSYGHLALAEYYGPGGYKRGRHPAETWDELTLEYMDAVKNEATNYVDDDIEMTWSDARSLGHDILVNYVNEYGTDDAWEVLWVERPGKQLIPNPLIKNKPIVNYAYTMDLIIRDHSARGRVRFVDHKFVKSVQSRHLWIDSQNGGYLAIATHQMRQEGIISEREAVRDLIYNFVRKQRFPEKGRNKFGEWLNKDGSVSKRQPSPFFERIVVERTAKERNQQITNIGNEALAMKAYRNGKLPIIKNPTRDCPWDCQFFTLCQVHEAQGDVETTKKMIYREEDPYQEYYEDAISPKRLQGDQ